MSSGDLRALRRRAGLTQQEVAEQLRVFAQARGAELGIRNAESLAVDGQMVSKWERGEKRPSPIYRKLLSELFEIPYIKLWGSGPTSVADEGGDDTNRRGLLVDLGLSALILPFGSFSGRPDFNAYLHGDINKHIATLEHAVSVIEERYEYAEPGKLLPLIERMHGFADEAIALRMRPGQRVRLFRAAAQLSSLHANAVFNAADIKFARQLVQEALHLAEMSGDTQVAGWAFINASMIELYAGNPAAARDIASLGQEKVRQGPLFAYLANFEARAHAVLCDPPQAIRAVARSYEEMDRLSPQQQGAPGFSMSTYNRADLDCETVTVFTTLERPKQAATYASAAHQGIQHVDKTGVRAQVLFPEARAHLQLGDLEQACALIREAHALTVNRRPWWYLARMDEFFQSANSIRDTHSLTQLRELVRGNTPPHPDGPFTHTY